MKYIFLFFGLVMLQAWGLGQTPVSLPIGFEGGAVTTSNFGNFNGGIATVINNPYPGGINASATVGRLVRNGGADFAGSFLNMTAPLDFSVNTTICMKVYTTAVIGTPVVLKIEIGGTALEITQNTTVSSAWETLCFDFSSASANNTRLTFLFNLGTVGDGSANSTFYFDDIEQPAALSGDEVALPLDFEGSVVDTDNFGDLGGGFAGGNGFGGGAATVIANTVPGGINSSATIGQIIRHPGSIDAGAHVDLVTNLNFDAYPIICMNLFTTAPIGTTVVLRIEDTDSGQPDIDASAVTTESGVWEPLCFVFLNAPAAYDRITFLFDLGGFGDASANSTFLFDDVDQLVTPIGFFFTPGSQYFCPPNSLTLTFPGGSGNYNWYEDQAGLNLVGTGPTFVTPVLLGSDSYFVQDLASTNIPSPIDVGPTNLGQAAETLGPAVLQFTSNIDNGLWHGVSVVSQFINPLDPNCEYTVTGRNLTPPITSTTEIGLISTLVPANANMKQQYSFSPPIPMNIGDAMELEVSVSGTGCRIRSFELGGPTIPGYPSTTTNGELTFTGYNSTSNPSFNGQRWMGFDYQVSGDVLADPTIYQVNTIADCANPLPIELIDFTVREDHGDALLNWTTASEINNDRFMLLRTSDGFTYETIGIVYGAGNSSAVLHYSFRDTDPLNGVSYYKLRQVDFDGTESSSELVAFRNLNEGDFNLFPNPTSGELTLTHSESYDNLQLRVCDLSGRLISEHSFGSAERVGFRLNGTPGAYFIEVSAGGQRQAVFNVIKL